MELEGGDVALLYAADKFLAVIGGCQHPVAVFLQPLGTVGMYEVEPFALITIEKRGGFVQPHPVPADLRHAAFRFFEFPDLPRNNR